MKHAATNHVRVLSFLLLLGMAPALHAQELSAIPAAFVDIGFGARPAALGNAYVGLADDAHSIHWNPAGMAQQQQIGVAFSYTDLLGLFEYQHAAVTVPLGSRGVQSVGGGVIATGDDALREITASVAYSRAFAQVFSVGVGVKYRRASFGNNALNADDYVVFDPSEVSEGLANQVSGNASGFGVDVGLLYTPSPRVRVGLMLRDLAAPMNWSSASNNPDRAAAGEYSEAIPFEAALGTVYRVNESFLVTADYSPAIDSALDDKVRVGVEGTFLGVFALRGGMQQVVNNRSDESYALGFGLNIPMLQDVRVQANYTYLMESLANSQHLSVGLQF